MSPYIKQDQRFQLNDHIDKLVYSMDHMGDDARKGVFNYVFSGIVPLSLIIIMLPAQE